MASPAIEIEEPSRARVIKAMVGQAVRLNCMFAAALFVACLAYPRKLPANCNPTGTDELGRNLLTCLILALGPIYGSMPVNLSLNLDKPRNHRFLKDQFEFIRVGYSTSCLAIGAILLIASSVFVIQIRALELRSCGGGSFRFRLTAIAVIGVAVVVAVVALTLLVYMYSTVCRICRWLQKEIQTAKMAEEAGGAQDGGAV